MDRMICNTKKRQELTFLVIKSLMPKYANMTFDYNILIKKKIYKKVIYNRICKSIQCF